MRDGRPRSGERVSTCEAGVIARRRHDVLGADAELGRARTDARARRDTATRACTTDGRARRDAATRACTTDGRARSDATSAADGGSRRDVRTRARLVLASARIGAAHDVPAEARAVEMVVVAVRVVGRVAERPADGVAVVPVPIGTGGRPADVVVAGARAPHDPRARVRSTRDPRPAVTVHVHPAPVVKRRPAPRVVGDPDVARVLGVRPVAGRRVRNEVGADLGLATGPRPCRTSSRRPTCRVRRAPA